MEDKSLLLQHMGDTPKLRIIDFFLDHRESDYSKKEIIKHSGISKTRFRKAWNEVLEFEFLKTTRKYNKTQLYALNLDNMIIQKVKELDSELARQAMEKATNEPIPAQ